MTWLDFVVLIFAASGIVDVWKNGSIFADWRAFFETDDAPADASAPQTFTREEMTQNLVDEVTGSSETKLPWLMRLADRYTPQFVAELLSCSFCLSHHTPWMVGVVFFFPALFVTTPWLAFLLKLPAYSLAATRIGNLINAVAPKSAKYDQ